MAAYEWLFDLSTAPHDVFGRNDLPIAQDESDKVTGIDYYFGDAQMPVASVEKGSAVFDALVMKSTLGKRKRNVA